jgi:hypothetical protein
VRSGAGLRQGRQPKEGERRREMKEGKRKIGKREKKEKGK